MSRLLNKVLRPFQRRPSGVITFTGDYANWADAVQHSTGYDAGIILERTDAALLKIKNGEAVFERDSYLFDKPEYPLQVLAALFRAALLNEGSLSMVDFGGSLGSSYFQCRPLMPPLKQLEWMVIEQAAHVARGRQHFETKELLFYESLKDCLVDHHPTVLLLSSVLQYLPDPAAQLRELLKLDWRQIIIDRTPFLESHRDRLTVQTVPESIYPASYPAWFFDETKFAGIFTTAGYSLVADFPGADKVSPEDEPAYFKGFIFEKKVAR